jgi:ABC-type sugar transport system permease subunit
MNGSRKTGRMTTNGGFQAKLSRQNLGEATVAWFMIAPAALGLIVFLIVPFFMAFQLSLTNTRLLSPNPPEFIALENYGQLLRIAVIPLEPLKDEAIGEVQRDEAGNVLYTPVVVPMVVVSVVWLFLYNPGVGTINAFLEAISFGRLGPQEWLFDPKLAFPSIMLLSIWQGVGFQMVIFLAGLQEIPGEHMRQRRWMVATISKSSFPSRCRSYVTRRSLWSSPRRSWPFSYSPRCT